MSDENLEIVRRVIRYFADGDIEAALADVDPEATLDWSNSDAPDSGVYTGHIAWRAFYQARDDAFGELRFDSVEFLTPADDTVVLIAHVQQRGRASGIEVESRGCSIWTLCDGKIVRFKIYQSSDEALKAVGLAEYAMSQETMEFAERGLVAINETYRTGDMRAWRAHVEETFDPDIVLETSGEAFTEGEWRGHEGAVGFVANQMEVLDDMWLRVDEYLRVDSELVVVAISFGGRAQHTGIEVELHPLHVFRLRDGKAVRWQVFLDRAKALEATGLGE